MSLTTPYIISCVVRTLYDRKDSIVTDPEDRDLAKQHINSALKVCGYPEWVLKRVKNHISHKKEQSKSRTTKNANITQNTTKNTMVVLPYIQGTTEAVPTCAKTT